MIKTPAFDGIRIRINQELIEKELRINSNSTPVA